MNSTLCAKKGNYMPMITIYEFQSYLKTWTEFWHMSLKLCNKQEEASFYFPLNVDFFLLWNPLNLVKIINF